MKVKLKGACMCKKVKIPCFHIPSKVVKIFQNGRYLIDNGESVRAVDEEEIIVLTN